MIFAKLKCKISVTSVVSFILNIVSESKKENKQIDTYAFNRLEIKGVGYSLNVLTSFVL